MTMQNIGHFEDFCNGALRPACQEPMFYTYEPPLTEGERGLGFMYVAAAAAGPSAPFVLAASAIASILAPLIGKIGPDPRNIPDSATIEAGQIALNRLWYDVSGEKLPWECVPQQCGVQRVAIYTPSKYPSVPKGPGGDLSINIDAAIGQADAIVQQAAARLLNPERSGKDQFFQPGGRNNIPGLLRQMKTYRQKAAATAAASGVTAATGIPGAGISPLALLGIGAAALAAVALA